MAVGAIRRALRWTAAAGTGLTTVFMGWLAMAQTAPPPKLVFDVATTLDADSNRSLNRVDPDSSLRLDTRLGFAFDSRTRTDQLQFSGSGLLRLDSGGASLGSGLQEPRLRFAYARDTGNAKLSATASYSQLDVNGFDALLLPDGTLGSDIARNGTVTDSALGLSLQTGVNDPIGFILSANASRRDYSQTTDPDVYDSRRQALDFTTRLTLSPLTRIDLNFGYAEARDETVARATRTDRSGSIRLDQALSPILNLQSEIGYSRNQRDSTVLGLPVAETSEGLFGQVGLSLKQPNGTASVTLSSARDVGGLRNTLRFGRDLDLPRGGKLAVDLGVSAREGDDAALVGSLRYSEPLPSGQIEARLDRSVTLDANNDDVTATRLGLTYSHEINALSRLSLSADIGRTSTDGAAANTTTRSAFRASYTRDLTQDWSLETGYQYRDRSDDGGRADSNSVFVTVKRKFTAWP